MEPLCGVVSIVVILHILWEGHKILRNLHRRLDQYYIGQIYGGDFSKFCSLLRIYELYWSFSFRVWDFFKDLTGLLLIDCWWYDILMITKRYKVIKILTKLVFFLDLSIFLKRNVQCALWNSYLYYRSFKY